VIRLMHDRARTIPDFVDFASYFYTRPVDYDEKYKQKHWTPESRAKLSELLPEFANTSDWTHPTLEEVVRKLAEKHGISAGKLIHPIRLAVTGRGMGPGLFELLEVIGKDETTARIESALSTLN
jgi:glutamyl/glutaminyl-tRNA synthetase